MQEFEKKDFQKILKHNGLEARRWMNETDSSAVRVYDRNLEAFPVTVELYSGYARIADYSSGLSDEDLVIIKDIVSRFLYIEHDKIIFYARKKREGREQHEKNDESLVLSVRENGLEFECELLKYMDTGLFLDHVNTRKMIREMAAGMRVLNLFSYTGSFSVYAAAGGAESVVSVDLSNVYSEWAMRNLRANGFLDERKYSVVTGDAKSYLEKAVDKRELFDIVIFDPPAFSNSHKAGDFDVKKDYLEYLCLISRVLADGGVCMMSENIAGFEFEKKLLKPYWKIQELSQELKAQGFSSKKNALRIWMMKKVAEMKMISKGYGRREMNEDERIERLTIDESGKESERKESRERKERDWDNETGRLYRGERPRRDDRPRRYEDRPRRYDDRPRRFEDDRPRRYSDDRPRRFDDDRPRRYEDRPQRYRADERKPYRPAEGRKRNAPKPYGYDTFMVTKERDKGDAFWLKNTVFEKKDDE